ncbi:MAG: hypothetical protein R3Y10_05550 [Ferrimonas sp.]
MWLAIVVVVILGLLLGLLPQARRQVPPLTEHPEWQSVQARITELEQQQQILSERVQTLERILTDQQYDLQEQIRNSGTRG